MLTRQDGWQDFTLNYETPLLTHKCRFDRCIAPGDRVPYTKWSAGMADWNKSKIFVFLYCHRLVVLTLWPRPLSGGDCIGLATFVHWSTTDTYACRNVLQLSPSSSSTGRRSNAQPLDAADLIWLLSLQPQWVWAWYIKRQLSPFIVRECCVRLASRKRTDPTPFQIHHPYLLL